MPTKQAIIDDLTEQVAFDQREIDALRDEMDRREIALEAERERIFEEGNKVIDEWDAALQKVLEDLNQADAQRQFLAQGLLAIATYQGEDVTVVNKLATTFLEGVFPEAAERAQEVTNAEVS